ncbi:hypothetical protein KWG64_22945 [Rahnella sp. PD12R]|uniref:hypothetical protein n=1 Tax=Rahnella sp. PD12R TaxID=2855688 RepID=UPI001C494A87|nr:hypothetical protein [Rahnella sp. PD12R]MBV6820804.1 hypothetical protein [Rahnella sp. PD12R]
MIVILFSFILKDSMALSKKPFKLTGVFSSLHFNNESGDLLGEELIILYSKDGYNVIFQTSEGEPTVPVITKAEIEKDIITFTLPPPLDIHGEFSGEISKEKIIGKFERNEQVLILMRKNSYWQ